MATSCGGGETLRRTVFGIGAAITWICLIALAIGGARKIFRSKV